MTKKSSDTLKPYCKNSAAPACTTSKNLIQTEGNDSRPLNISRRHNKQNPAIGKSHHGKKIASDNTHAENAASRYSKALRDNLLRDSCAVTVDTTLMQRAQHAIVDH